MCNAMDVPLPLLPFSGKAEYQLFAKMMLRNKGPVDEVKFAMEWCKYVDPEQNIHAKLPCHIRVQVAKFDRNQRIRDAMAKAKSGRDALDELHSKVLPRILDEECSSDAQEDDTPAENNAPSRKRKQRAAGLIHSLREPQPPRPFPVPPPQVLHAAPYVLRGGMIIGNMPLPHPAPKKNTVCTLCLRNRGNYAHSCPGKSRHSLCRHFNANNTPKYVYPMPPARQRATRTCRNCSVVGCKGSGGRRYCTNK